MESWAEAKAGNLSVSTIEFWRFRKKVNYERSLPCVCGFAPVVFWFNGAEMIQRGKGCRGSSELNVRSVHLAQSLSRSRSLRLTLPPFLRPSLSVYLSLFPLSPLLCNYHTTTIVTLKAYYFWNSGHWVPQRQTVSLIVVYLDKICGYRFRLSIGDIV